MLSFIIMFLGLGLVIWSLYMIQKDIERGRIKFMKGLDGVSDHNLDRIIRYLDELEKQMNDMNASFYDLVSDLEGSFSIHDKELQLVSERIEKIEKQLSQVTSEVRIEKREAINTEVNKAKFKKYQTQEISPKSEILTQTSISKEVPVNEAQTKDSELRGPIMKLTPEEAHHMKQRIVALRKEGHSLSQIAKILNVGFGELQLFIKLNTK